MRNAPCRVVVAQGAPQPGGVDEQLERRRRARTPRRRWRPRSATTASAMSALMWNAAVPAGQYAEHSSPRIVRHGKAAPSRPSCAARSPGQRQGAVPPAQRVRGRVRLGVGEHRQHERLGVPEGVAVVAGAGQALGRDRPLLGPGPGLQHVEQREADRLLDLGVPLDLDVGAGPEVVQVLALLGQQPVPAGEPGARRARRRPGRARRAGAVGGPAIAEELHQLQALAGLRARGATVNAPVGRRPWSTSAVPAPDTRCACRGHPQAAVAGPVHQHGAGLVGHVLLASSGASSAAAVRGSLPSGGSASLATSSDCTTIRERRVERLDLVADGGDRPLGERDEPLGVDPHRRAGRRDPLGVAASACRRGSRASARGGAARRSGRRRARRRRAGGAACRWSR